MLQLQTNKTESIVANSFKNHSGLEHSFNVSPRNLNQTLDNEFGLVPILQRKAVSVNKRSKQNRHH